MWHWLMLLGMQQSWFSTTYIFIILFWCCVLVFSLWVQYFFISETSCLTDLGDSDARFVRPHTLKARSPAPPPVRPASPPSPSSRKGFRHKCWGFCVVRLAFCWFLIVICFVWFLLFFFICVFVLFKIGANPFRSPGNKKADPSIFGYRYVFS